jgi:hypothetical protein
MTDLNIDWENIFVNNFLVERVRDRSLFELRSLKRRKDFFNKMCHNYLDMLICDYVLKLPSFQIDMEINAIKTILVKYGAKDNCYFMSHNEDSNDKIIAIENGLEICRSHSMPVFLICTENLVFFHGHYDGKNTPEFILSRNQKNLI